MAKNGALLRVRKNKALKLFHEGDLKAARHVLETLCRPGSDLRDPECWCLLGVICGELGDFDVSVQSCTKAVKLEPTYVEAWYNLGLKSGYQISLLNIPYDARYYET